MKKIGFWDAAFNDISHRERVAFNDAAHAISLQETVGTNNALGLEKLFALDRAQEQEILQLKLIVDVLTGMLMESGAIDGEELRASVQSQLEAATAAKEVASKAEPTVFCSRCGQEVPSSGTQITAQGTVCDSCYYAAGP